LTTAATRQTQVNVQSARVVNLAAVGTPTYLGSEAMKAYMDRERELYRASLLELGLIK